MMPLHPSWPENSFAVFRKVAGSRGFNPLAGMFGGAEPLQKI